QYAERWPARARAPAGPRCRRGGCACPVPGSSPRPGARGERRGDAASHRGGDGGAGGGGGAGEESRESRIEIHSAVLREVTKGKTERLRLSAAPPSALPRLRVSVRTLRCREACSPGGVLLPRPAPLLSSPRTERGRRGRMPQ